MEATKKNEVRAALAITLAVAEAIREAQEIPSGTLYATLLGRVDIHGYNSLIRTLKNTGLIEEHANLLRWVGPEVRS